MGGVLYGNFTLPDMAYHLRCDIGHDHTPAILGIQQVADLIAPGAMPYTDEDTAVRHFMSKLIGDPRLDLVAQFKIITPTEQNPNATDFVFPATQNSDLKILHDAGPKLYVFLGATQLITFGTILDTAKKPGEGRRLVSKPKELSVNLDVLGFADTVGPLKIDNMTDSKVYTTLKYNRIEYDPVRMKEAIGANQAKDLNIPKGFYASVNDVKAAVNRRAPLFELFVVGKALGDGLQVLSLTPKYNSEAFTVLSTEDRLNHIRAIAYNVSSVLISRANVKSPVRIGRFMPSTEFLKSVPEQIQELLGRTKDLIKVLVDKYDTVIFQFEWDTDHLMPKPYREECASLLKKFKTYVLYKYYKQFLNIEIAASEGHLNFMRNRFNMLKDGISTLCPKSLPYRQGLRSLNQTFVICNPRANQCPNSNITSISLRLMIDELMKRNLIESDRFIETSGFSVNYADGSDTGLAGAYKLSLIADKGDVARLRKYTKDWFGPEQAPSGIPDNFPPIPDSPMEAEAEVEPLMKRPKTGSSRRSDPPTDDFWYFEQYVREFGMDPIKVMLVAYKSPDSVIIDRGALPTLAGDIDLTTLPDIGKGPWKREASVWNAFTANLNAAHSEYPKTKFPWPSAKPEIKNALQDFYLLQESCYRTIAKTGDPIRAPIGMVSVPRLVEPVGAGRLRKSTIRVSNAVDLHKRTRRARRLRKATSRTRNSRLVRFNSRGDGDPSGDSSATS